MKRVIKSRFKMKPEMHMAFFVCRLQNQITTKNDPLLSYFVKSITLNFKELNQCVSPRRPSKEKRFSEFMFLSLQEQRNKFG